MYELALPREEVFARAAAIEGHPDNVAASLHGGFVVCADGNVTVVEPPAGLEAIAVVPARACADRRGARGAAGRGAARPTRPSTPRTPRRLRSASPAETWR